MTKVKIPEKWMPAHCEYQSLVERADEDDREHVCETFIVQLIEELAALTARAEAAEIDWEENNALAAAKVCLEAENANLTARAEAAEQELAMVDEALARRPAVADAPNRYTAISAAFNMASRTDKAEAMEKHWKFHYEKQEAENATLRTQLQQAKDGWDSAIADLREASGICKQAEQDRDEAHSMVREAARIREQDLVICENMIGRKDDEIRGLEKELKLRRAAQKATNQ